MRRFPTKDQVIEMMRQGWELGRDMTSGGWRIQKGGLGFGGATLTVHSNTACALIKAGRIMSLRRQWPREHFGLKEEL